MRPPRRACRCKGEGTCSTACFAKYGSSVLDDFLHCAVEKQDCVHVPRDESRATWKDPDAAGASKIPVPSFEIASLEGQWWVCGSCGGWWHC